MSVNTEQMLKKLKECGGKGTIKTKGGDHILVELETIDVRSEDWLIGTVSFTTINGLKKELDLSEINEGVPFIVRESL